MSGEPLLKHGPNDTYSSVFHGYTISKISLLCLFVCAVIHVIIYLWRYTFDCMPYIILKGPKHYAHTFTFLNHNNAHCTQSFTLTWELFSNDLYNLSVSVFAADYTPSTGSSDSASNNAAVKWTSPLHREFSSESQHRWPTKKTRGELLV